MVNINNFKCDQCSKNFIREVRQIRKNSKNCFCSKQCGYNHIRHSIELPCGNCKKPTVRLRAVVNSSKSGFIFCSQSCSAIYSNTHKKQGTRRSKLEAWLEEQLREKYPTLDILCNQKNAINSELDIHFPALNLAFELNGIFHYEPIYGQDKLNKIQNNDNRKYQACIENKIELCIIDTSKFGYFKISGAMKFLDIIINIVDNSISKNIAANIEINSTDINRGFIQSKTKKEITCSTYKLMEKAISWNKLIQTENLTKADIARLEQKSRAYITNVMKLLELPQDIQKALLDKSYAKISFKKILSQFIK